MYHPTSSVAGIAAALSLLSGVAGAAVQVFAPNPSFVGDASQEWFVSFDPLAKTMEAGSAGPLTFCISTNMLQATIQASRNGIYELVAMPFANEFYEFERLDAGAEISAATIGDSTFGYIDFSGYTPDERFYVGFAFRERNTTDEYYYSYADVSFATNGDITIYGYAYNDEAGASITTAPIPEPGSAMLAAAGVAFGALGIRRRARRGDAA